MHGDPAASRLAWQGALLFAFIPLVLVLYLRQPFGPSLSLGLGVAVMSGHRFIAGPWMTRHASERCLWCGRGGSLLETEIEVKASGRTWRLRACDGEHHDRIGRFLTFVAKYSLAIAAGIFVPLLVLLAGTLMIAVGHPVIPNELNRLQFRLIVAITVVGTSLGYLRVRRREAPLSCPFPIHNLFLLGIGKTLWVFRAVWVWWLVVSGIELARIW